MYFLIGSFGGPAPPVRRGEVLPVQPGRRPDHAGRRHRAVRGEQQPAGRGHLRLRRAARAGHRPGRAEAAVPRLLHRLRHQGAAGARSTPGCPTPVPRRRSAAAVLLVGVLDKVGTFGFLRYCLPLFPDASRYFAPFVLVLAVVGILYAALLAMGQSDMKRLVAYTSISHFGFIALGHLRLHHRGRHRRGAVHGQPRHRDRPAVPGRRHGHRPRRVAADRRLRRHRGQGAAPGRRLPHGGSGLAGAAGHQQLRQRVPRADRRRSRPGRSSRSSRRSASSWPRSTCC